MTLKLDVAQRVVSANKIDAGTWMPVTMPGDASSPVFADAEGKFPAEVLVRSYRSKSFKDRVYAANAAQASARKSTSKNMADLVREGEETGRPRNFSWLVMGMRNLDSSQLGVVVIPSEEDLFALAQQPDSQWLVDQVMNHAYTDSNYGAEASGNDAAGGKTSS